MSPRFRTISRVPLHACGLASLPRTAPRFPAHACVFTALLLAALPACSGRIGGSAKPDRVIAQLRTRVASLEAENQTLHEQLARATADAQSSPQSETQPVFAVLRFDRYTGFAAADPRVVRVYLRTLTQDDRFIPIQATASLRLFRVPLDGQPQVIAQRDIDAQTFHDAYRAGFTGAHFTLDLPLPADFTAATFAPADTLLLKVTVTERSSGLTLAADKTLPLPAP